MSVSDLLAVPDVRRLADAIRGKDGPTRSVLWGKLQKKLALVDPMTLKSKPKK